MPRFFGQHFLHDPRILDRIVDALFPLPDDVVVEVGPGEGTLTRRLAPRVGAVVAIEKDRRLIARLGATALPDNVRVVEGDALELDWHAECTALRPRVGRLKICGNIPYYITSPLIERALRPPLPATIVFLVQAEVAERVVAPPGSKTYGALSVGVQAVARAERLFPVRAGAFQPRPAVDSAVLRLTPRTDPLIGDGERAAFRRFVTGLFGQRRKQLRRSLRDVAALDRDTTGRALARIGIDPASRPEVLTPEQLVSLFQAVMR